MIDRERTISLSRVDYLLSGFTLLSEDGKETVADQSVVGLVKVGEGRRTIDLGTVPSGDFVSLRFSVGLPAELDEADPNQFSPTSPLNPVTSGLHWGWMGGYVYLALEGFIEEAEGGRGLSYHLAGEGNQVVVELPLTLSQAKRQTVVIQFDLKELLNGGDKALFEEKLTTHSRSGDPALSRMKRNLSRSFDVAELKNGFYREIGSQDSNTRSTRFPIAVSERFPVVEETPGNAITQRGVELGLRLFKDERLSRDNSLSCMSCHDPRNAFSDTNALSVGVSGRLGKRNSMPLFNLAWAGSFFWDGRADTLEEQVLHPIQERVEMDLSIEELETKLNSVTEYKNLFFEAFGSERITADLVAKALAQYLRTLVSQDSRFDKAMRGEIVLSDQEKRGFQLFVTENDPQIGLRGADCFHCHGGNLFTDLRFTSNGLPNVEDLGRFGVTGDTKDRAHFKTPSLRNVELTAPYMHDGRFDSLEEVVKHYNEGVVIGAHVDPNLTKHGDVGLQLSDRELDDLVAFLRTLTDYDFIQKHRTLLVSELP